jgi:hypothetical protein
MSDKVTIPINVYRSLIRDSWDLESLRSMGVDNWSGYDEVEWPSDEEIEAEVQEAIDQSK